MVVTFSGYELDGLSQSYKFLSSFAVYGEI